MRWIMRKSRTSHLLFNFASTIRMLLLTAVSLDKSRNIFEINLPIHVYNLQLSTLTSISQYSALFPSL
jgi:hypothetical protein